MSDLRSFVSFDGTLQSDGLQWAMAFKARLDGDGEIEFEIAPLPVTKETFEINRLWHEERGTLHNFELTGTAPDGTRFSSKTVHFTRLSMPSDETGSRLELRARCTVGNFTQTIEPTISKLAVRQGLRGFECFRSHYANCPLGEIQLAGVTPLPEGNGLSGWLHIVSDTRSSDSAEWRKDVLKLFEHIRHVMSFAESRAIKSPFTQTWSSDTFTTEVFSQTPARGPGMQVFHHLNLQPVFDVAVASFFKPPIPAKKLYFAIEWFAMHATYSETRLLNAMTALENLTNANLEDNEQFLLPEKRFGEISRVMRRAFSSPVGDAEESFRAGLAGKMEDLNRRPLRDKITLLAKRWNVPLDDLPPKALGAAITARNEIVHRGHYYDDETDKKEKESLWGHILLVREVVLRMILATLGFKGRYISFLGGAYHDADYPPSEPAVTAALQGAPDDARLTQAGPTDEESEVAKAIAEARARTDALSASLPVQVDVAALCVLSKAPFQLLCAREALIWRTEEIGRNACDALEQDDLCAAGILTRAVIEGTALTWKLMELLDAPGQFDASELNDILMKVLMGTRQWADMPQAFQVLTCVDKLDRQIPGVRATYDSLCEIAHPNWAGALGLYSTPDPERFITNFGRGHQRARKTRGMIADALVGSLCIFERAYNRIADTMPVYLSELEKIWPDSQPENP